MKISTYYLALAGTVLVGAILAYRPAPAMGMGTIISVTTLVGLIAIAILFVGENKAEDEREIQHRLRANRLALVAGSVVLALGIAYQLFNHTLDYSLIAALLTINVVKISSLIYSHYNQ